MKLARKYKSLCIQIGTIRALWANRKEWYFELATPLFGLRLQNLWPLHYKLVYATQINFSLLAWPHDEGGFIYRFRWEHTFKEIPYDR